MSCVWPQNSVVSFLGIFFVLGFCKVFCVFYVKDDEDSWLKILLKTDWIIYYPLSKSNASEMLVTIIQKLITQSLLF